MKRIGIFTGTFAEMLVLCFSVSASTSFHVDPAFQFQAHVPCAQGVTASPLNSEASPAPRYELASLNTTMVIRQNSIGRQAVIDAVRNTHPVAFWMLDDAVGSTTVKDQCGNYPGTVSASGVTLGAQGPVLNGAQALGAMLSNTGGGYISLGTPTTFGSATSFSISAWAYCTSLLSVPHVMASRGTTGGRWWLRWESSGEVSAYIGDGTHAVYVLSSSSVSLSTWHHLCAVFNRSNNYSYLYIDGNVQTPVSIAAVGSCDNNGTWNIGDDPDGHVNRYTGTLACVGVWNRALSAAEVSALYNNMVHQF